MKKTGLLAFLILVVQFSRAQRFFYIDHNPVTENLLKEGFRKACQYVTRSPMVSDYTISSEVALQPESNTLTLQLILKDSVTLKTIYETNEVYVIEKSPARQRLFLNMAIRTFIEKNMQQMVSVSKDDHLNGEMRFLKARKDKT